LKDREKTRAQVGKGAAYVDDLKKEKKPPKDGSRKSIWGIEAPFSILFERDLDRDQTS